MIEQNVQVVRCQGDRLWVRLGSQSGCVACDNGNGCGAGLFAKLLRGKPVVMELARNNLTVEAGQVLTLAFPDHVYLKLVFASYGWPLLAAIAGASAGYGMADLLGFEPALLDAFTLLGGLLAGAFIVRIARHRANAQLVLGSLHATLYYSAEQPNICSNSVNSR